MATGIGVEQNVMVYLVYIYIYKLAVFGGFRHFPKIEGPFPKIEGQDFERIWLAAHHDHSSNKEKAFPKMRARLSILGSI